MVESGSRPSRGRIVAGVALRSGRNMRGRFGLGILRQIATAMAGNTLSSSASMVHDGRRPTAVAAPMAGVALFGGQNSGFDMCRWFSLRPLRHEASAMAS